MKFKIIIFTLFLHISFLAFTQKNNYKTELKPYVEYLQNNKLKSAKNYILSKFQTKDIVIISERDHRDLSQYDVIFDVLKSPKFKGNIYTEVGSSNNYKKINKFLLTSNLSVKEIEKELTSICRDLNYNVIWEKYNYYALLKTIYKINKNRKNNDKILLFPLDVKFDWKEINCHSQYEMFNHFLDNHTINRNIIMGQNFVKFYEYEKQRNPDKRKALVIENTYHGYIRIPKNIPLSTQPEIFSTGEYIYKTYPKLTTNIYVNYFTQGFSKGLTNNGLFDAAFYYTNTDNVGFDLINTPFGNSKFDLYNFGERYNPDVNFDYIFDGMIYYKPISEMDLVVGIPNIYPKEYEKIFFEKCALFDNISYEQSVNKYNKYLKKINKIKHFGLSDKNKRKINSQIKQWFNK